MKNLSYKLFFKAFSNETRFCIINLLRNGPKSVSEICEELNFEQSRVSHNLKCLTNCGFVTNKRIGKKRIYSLNRETILPLLKIIDKHIGKYQRHLLKCGVLKK